MDFVNLLDQGRDIVRGHINESLGLHKDISVERMKICKTCPLFKAAYGGICNSNLYMNPKTLETSSTVLPGYIHGCGCRLNAKTRLPYATCPAHRW